jgi:prepilin-type N-terminal cleavage/methylation domain-containing protein
MQSLQTKIQPGTGKNAFTLIEMLVVIAIMSILMTAGSIGLSGMGGKGVTSGVATAESLFDEARTTAVGRNTSTRVMILKSPPDSNKDYSNVLRRIVVASQEIDATTGQPKPDSWIMSSRGAVLPDQTFFSQEFSKKDLASGGQLDEFTPSGWKPSYQGTYFYYEFNSQGICKTPGASFIIGSGARNSSKPATGTDLPRVTGSAKRDFGGFVIWRNGTTSVFRNPDQMKIPSTLTYF